MSVARLRKYKGKKSTAIDPHWDFEQDPGEAYDLDALRLWRTRVFVSGPEPAHARLRLSFVADGTAEEEGSAARLLRPEDYVHRFVGGPELSPQSYVPLQVRMVGVDPPAGVFAVNLTRLYPGAYTFTIELFGAGGQDTEMRFTVKRRPFYTLHDPRERGGVSSHDGAASGPRAPEGPGRLSVRSSTGLREIVDGGVRRLLTAHAWKIHRNAWTAERPPALGYTRVDTLDTVAVTLFREDCTPLRTRFRIMEEGKPPSSAVEAFRASDFERWHTPGEHACVPEGESAGARAPADGARFTGFGVPFPTLVGLKRQPEEDGEYPPLRAKRSGSATPR